MFKGCGKTSAKASIGSEKLPPRTTVRRVLLASAQCVASVWPVCGVPLISSAPCPLQRASGQSGQQRLAAGSSALLQRPFPLLAHLARSASASVLPGAQACCLELKRVACACRLCVSPVRAACWHGTRVQRVRSMSWPSAGVSAGASTRMKARPCSGCARCPLRLDAAVCALPLASPTPHSPRLRACVRSLAARLRPPLAASSPFDIAGERVGGTAVRAVHAVLCVRCVALTRWPSCAHVI